MSHGGGLFSLWAGKACLLSIGPHGGLKIARVVEEVSRRPQVQERMTQTIADLVSEHLQTSGVGVVISAEHSCMAIRGIKKPGSLTITSALRGNFKTNPATRAEFMSLIGNPGR
jgi:GTP cyclohydrolase I